jgi:hypothetical protein
MLSLQDLILDESRLRRLGAILAYLVGTILIAYWVGTFQIFFLYLVVQLAILLYLILWAQRRAWILILLGWSLTGPTAFFRVPISVRDFSVLATVCAYMVYRVVSRDAMRQRWRFLDAIIAINAVYLVFTFVLNPVGLYSFGAETIGARPYFTIALALAGYWVIWRLPNSIKTVSRIPLFILAGSAAATSLFALAYVFPSLPSRIPYLYMALSVEAYFSDVAVMQEAIGSQIVRYKELGSFGITLLMTLFAYTPSLAILNPLRLRFYALAGGAVCVFLAGFRNLFAAACALFGFSVWLHRGFGRFLMACVVGGALLLGLAAGQGRFYHLPFSVQRTLSLLPGDWDPLVARDTEASTEGRIKWWRQVLEEHLIKDLWFGDGFGASVGEVALASQGGAGEMAFVTGSLHSGPLTAVRYVGVVGLLLLYALMIVSAVYGWGCVQRCKGTLLQPVAIYLAIQLIWIPINYTFIFGAYNSAMPEQIFLVALLRLVMRMAERLPASSPASGLTQPNPGVVVATRA